MNDTSYNRRGIVPIILVDRVIISTFQHRPLFETRLMLRNGSLKLNLTIALYRTSVSIFLVDDSQFLEHVAHSAGN